MIKYILTNKKINITAIGPVFKIIKYNPRILLLLKVKHLSFYLQFGLDNLLNIIGIFNNL